MTHSRSSLSKAVGLLIPLCLLNCLPLWADGSLNDLTIRVVLRSNGDAQITETRQMWIDSNGTECYISIGNLNGSELRDFKVTDETGLQYTYNESWDVNDDRDEKAGRCGIVDTGNGYELCWGLGETGSRTYTTSYTVTNLLRGYADADGFNYMFVAENIRPYPEHVKLTIVPEDTLTFTQENTGVWGFRYKGEIGFDSHAIMSESTEGFSAGSAMIVMCRFEKGLFSPAIVSDGSFEDVKNRAFEGSDYTDGGFDMIDAIMLILMVLGFVVLPVVGIIWYFIYVWRARRKVKKNLLWYRDIPLHGNLQKANRILNAYRYFGSDYNNLLSACILKLINLGAISIDSSLGKDGKTVQRFVIHELPNSDRQPTLLRKVHNIFKAAAGSDTVLEPQELKSYMKSRHNESIMDSFINTLHSNASISDYADHLDDVRHVLGLKKFLKEFTLLDERHVSEVSLWKDYMIYATLFGIADQVIRDMKKINPEYFDMDQVAQQMADDRTLPMIYSTMHSSTTRAAMSKAEREQRASGGGGSTSWGGGGGFSGGGSGGGIR